MRVLQAMEEWLPPTQDWLQAMLLGLPPEVTSTVVCERLVPPGGDPAVPVIVAAPGPRPRLVERATRRLGHIRPAVVATAIRDTAPDLVHAHFGHHGVRVSADVHAAARPLVVSFYGLDVVYLPRMDRRWAQRYRRLFDQAVAVLALGPWMAERLVELGAPPERVHVQHLGIDLDAVPFRPPPARDGGALRILIASSFRPKKGIPDAVAAVGRVAGTIPVELTIVGDDLGPGADHAERGAIMAAIQAAGLGDRTRVLPIAPRDALLAIADRADVLLAASRTAPNGDTEGTPMILVDMAALGVPIVSTRHADIPEVVQDGVTGWLADAGDVDGLAAHLQAVHDRPDEARARAEAGRRRVEAAFDATVQGRRLAASYAAWTSA